MLTAFSFLLPSLFFDIKRREIPNFITIPALLLSTFLRTAEGDFTPLVLLALFLIIGSLPNPRRFFPLLLSAALLLSPRSPSITSIWTASFTAWLFGFLGAADSKIAMALSALFPDISLGLFLLTGYTLWSLFLLFLKYRKKALLILLFPHLGERTEAPALPGILAGFTLYILWRMMK